MDEKRLCDCSYSELSQYCRSIWGELCAYAVLAAYDAVFRESDESKQEERWQKALRDDLPKMFKKEALEAKLKASSAADAEEKRK